MALQARGHAARIVANQAFETFVRGYGLDFWPIRLDMENYEENEAVKAATNADNPIKLLLSFQKMKVFAARMQEDLFDGCADAELIVYHPGAAIGYYAGQHFGVPTVLASPFPIAKTSAYPSVILYGRMPSNGVMNRLSYSVLQTALWSASKQPIEAFWRKRFSHTPKPLVPPFALQESAASPTVVGCSDRVFKKPADVSPYVTNTGFWFLEERREYVPPQALLDFIEDGSKPIYLGFGSMTLREKAQRIIKALIAAIEVTGQRVVLATGWQGDKGYDGVPSSVFRIDSIPHSWLFPRMAVVVHHGGAGTTAAGLRAGVPSIVIPFGNDQYAWGQRIFELGVGSKPIPVKKLTSEKLVAALDYCAQLEVIKSAEEMGATIREEKGVESAAEIILECLRLHTQRKLASVS